MSFPETPSHVYVPVPVDRVDDVFRLLLGLKQRGGEDVPEHLLQRAYSESDTQFQALLRYLAERPDEAIGSVQIANELGLANGTASLAGMLGAFARRAKNRYDGFWPFERIYSPGDEGSRLIMTAEIATAIKRLAA
ncbi:MAG TPA: hypothetical protein VFB52_07495 [Solirubrobacterales bacterium]|nr:hypothetical protein [Solirubrobacterales bacterium]